VHGVVIHIISESAGYKLRNGWKIAAGGSQRNAARRNFSDPWVSKTAPKSPYGEEV